jgi:hypothetical protein
MPPQEIEVAPVAPQKRLVELGNLAQWVSAGASVILMLIAVWVLFFSSTSQMLVGLHPVWMTPA